MTRLLTYISLIFALSASFSALAAPKIDLKMRAEIEVTVKENGKDVRKRVEAKEVEPGQEVIYTLSYMNSGVELHPKLTQHLHRILTRLVGHIMA